MTLAAEVEIIMYHVNIIILVFRSYCSSQTLLYNRIVLVC